MAEEPVDDELAIVAVNLKLGNKALSAEIAVPAGPTRLRDLLPIVQGISEAIADSSVAAEEAQGRSVSCKKGCAACCRQLVAITEVEARRIHDLVESLPEPNRAHVRARFSEARRRLDEAGLLDELLERETWDMDRHGAIVNRYFRQGIACPFLEEELCSIYADRPITCREYLVTSPAENCASVERNGIARIPMPVFVWTALAHFDELGPDAKFIRWVPLVIAPEWADSHPDESTPRPGPEWIRELFEQMHSQNESESP